MNSHFLNSSAILSLLTLRFFFFLINPGFLSSPTSKRASFLEFRSVSIAFICLCLLTLTACNKGSIEGRYESRTYKGLAAEIQMHEDGTSITVSHPYNTDQHPIAGYRKPGFGKGTVFERTMRDGVEKYVYQDKYECWLHPENSDILIARYFVSGMYGKAGTWKRVLLGRIKE
ncbi:MAG: hypothetical protein AAF587_38945 [Bacteroidota bacterium]